MTWTYGGDPSANAKDAIRFLIGDTDTTDQLLSNEEILWVNTEASGTTTGTNALYDAAYRCCLTIASKLARLADKQIGDLNVKLSQKAQGYLAQASQFNAMAKVQNFVPIPYAGGISISDKEIDQDNSDVFRGWFASGQFQNVDDGGANNTITGVQIFGGGADQ
jgi:hypothetical protein